MVALRPLLEKNVTVEEYRGFKAFKMQRNTMSYWMDHFETILPVCSHMPRVWVLWSPNGESEYLTYQTTTFSYLQFKSTSDSGIASCNVHLHHLQSLSRENLLFEWFFSPGKISIAYVITSGSTDGRNIFLQWKSWRIEPNHVISKPTFQVTLAMTAIPAHPLWQPSTNDYNFGSRHAKESFHCSMALCATTSQDSLHWIVTSFPALKKTLPRKLALHLTGEMRRWRNSNSFAN